MQIADLHIGPECEITVSEQGGIVSIAVGEGTPGVEAALTIKLPLPYFIGKLADLIPNASAKQALTALSAIVQTL